MIYWQMGIHDYVHNYVNLCIMPVNYYWYVVAMLLDDLRMSLIYKQH